jgi:putative sigma-54 modulation protein
MHIIFDYYLVSIGVTLFTVSKDISGLEVTMQIEIQARNFSITRPMRLHIERRLGFALGTCYRHVRRILVRLSDINGPRGGNDKRCHLEVMLPGQAVVVEDTEADLYVAINRAASRAGRTVMRQLRRRRHINRDYTPANGALSDDIA